MEGHFRGRHSQGQLKEGGLSWDPPDRSGAGAWDGVGWGPCFGERLQTKEAKPRTSGLFAPSEGLGCAGVPSEAVGSLGRGLGERQGQICKLESRGWGKGLFLGSREESRTARLG